MMTERRFAQKRGLDEASREGIRRTLSTALSGLPEVVFAYLHGSFVAESEFRDVDVAVFVESGVEEFPFESDLSYDLTKRTGLPVEVRVINRAPVAFQMAVLRGGHLLVARSEAALTDFIEDVGRQYREYKHFRDLFLAA